MTVTNLLPGSRHRRFIRMPLLVAHSSTRGSPKESAQPTPHSRFRVWGCHAAHHSAHFATALSPMTRPSAPNRGDGILSVSFSSHLDRQPVGPLMFSCLPMHCRPEHNVYGQSLHRIRLIQAPITASLAYPSRCSPENLADVDIKLLTCVDYIYFDSRFSGLYGTLFV